MIRAKTLFAFLFLFIVGQASSEFTVGHASSPLTVGAATLPSIVAQATFPFLVGQANAQSFSTGTGFVVAEDLAVTNYHVVEGSGFVLISFGSDSSTYPAEVVLSDARSDIAVLRIHPNRKGGSARGIRPLQLVESGSTRLGEDVFTVGYPLSGILDNSPRVTDGIVSAVTGASGDRHVFQISVPLQPGNSGGPLLNDRGEVVGVVTHSLNDSYVLSTVGRLPQNVNFAVKSDHVLALVAEVLGSSYAVSNGLTGRSRIDQINTAVESVGQIIAVQDASRKPRAIATLFRDASADTRIPSPTGPDAVPSSTGPDAAASVTGPDRVPPRTDTGTDADAATDAAPPPPPPSAQRAAAAAGERVAREAVDAALRPSTTKRSASIAETAARDHAIKIRLLKVRAGTAQMKKQPFTHGEVIRTVPSGHTVAADARNGNYYKVTYRGRTGYMHEVLFEKPDSEVVSTSGKSIVIGQKVEVSGSTAKLRGKPSPVGDVLAEMPRGSILTIREISGNYVLVRHEGRNGWVHLGGLR